MAACVPTGESSAAHWANAKARPMARAGARDRCVVRNTMRLALDNLHNASHSWKAAEWRGRVEHGEPRATVYHGRIEDTALSGSLIQRARVTSGTILLHRVSAGDQAAMQECIARFGGLIWSLARRIGLPESEAEDVVHEVFVEIWKNGHKYDASIASETAFVATIARRRMIDRRRRIGRQPIKATLTDDAGSPAPSPDAPALSEEARRAARAFAQLTNDQQRVLRLSVYEGLSHELISRATGMPLGTVKTHARRGLMRLREVLGNDAKAPMDDGGAA